MDGKLRSERLSDSSAHTSSFKYSIRELQDDEMRMKNAE